MSPRAPEAFRFDPPPLAAAAELRWVLLRAFAPPATASEAIAGPAALELAAALGLAARIAARQSEEQLANDLGAELADELREARMRAAALELRLDAALAAADGVLAARAVPYALLKGRALTLGGFAPAAGRPAADVDLLVPERRLGELQRALVAAGFRAPRDAAYEHQAPLLLHGAGGAIELHRSLPGVRLDGRRSATFERLVEEGLLVPLGAAYLPAREVLIAHAVAHTLAQHAFVAAHSGFQMVGDLIDLGCASVAATEAALLRWVERDVSVAELRAALELTDDLAAGELWFLDQPESRATRLAGHFVACATDLVYGAALRGRLFELPLSDRPRPLARLLLLLRTLVPPGGGLAGWLRRPVELHGRWRAARRAARGLAERDPR